MSEVRELCAVSSGDPERDRFDVLIHALAQLPDDVTLRLCGVRQRNVLELLGRGYGIGDRLHFANAPNGSAAMLSYAPTAARPGSDSPILFDPAGDPLEDSDGLTLAELVHHLADGMPAASLHGADDPLRRARVAVITNLPAPYRTPLFATVAKRLAAVDAAFRVFFLGAAERDRPWITQSAEPDFEFETLHSFRLGRGARPKLVPLDLEGALRRFRPTIVVCGGLSPAVALRAALAARAFRASFGVWSGDHAAMPTTKGLVRTITRRLVARQARFALAYGSLSAEYLHDLNSRLPTVLARNTSALAAAPTRQGDDQTTLRLLAVGDLASPRKGIDVLIEALGLVPDLVCRLTVVGGGTLLSDLSARSDNDPRIRFAGALPPGDMAKAYADADVFLFPSRQDVFGLALVEAMNAGLATVSSVAPGATADLCVNGVNCLLLDGDQPANWAAAIQRLVDDTGLRLRLGETARRDIEQRWTTEHSADAFVAGLRVGVLVKEVGE